VVGSTGEASAVAFSTAVAFAVTILVGATGVATGAITDSLMMFSSAASAFRGGGAGAIRTDITTITRTLTMDTAHTRMLTLGTVGTRTPMDTAATVTTVAPVMGIATEAARVMDMAMGAEPVTNTAMAADRGMSRVCGVDDKPAVGGAAMKYNINVIKSVWRRLRKTKPSDVRRDPRCSPKIGAASSHAVWLLIILGLTA